MYKKLVLIFFSFSMHVCFSQVEKKVEIDVYKNLITKNINSIIASDIYDDTLYVVEKNAFIRVSLVNGVISTEKKVNDFLQKLVEKKRFPNKLYVTKEGYYIGFIDEIYLATSTGGVKKVYKSNNHIVSFKVIDNKLIISEGFDSVLLISAKGKLLDRLKFNHGDDGFSNNSSFGLMYQANSETNIVEFSVDKNDKLIRTTYPATNAAIKIDDMFIAFGGDFFFLGFSYSKRDSLYLFKKENNFYRLDRKISIKDYNCLPSDSELADEEGVPNFLIKSSNNKLYIIVLAKKKLKVLSFAS